MLTLKRVKGDPKRGQGQPQKGLNSTPFWVEGRKQVKYRARLKK